MTIIRTVKVRPRYTVLALTSAPHDGEIYDRVAHKSHTGLLAVHRKTYSLFDWMHTAEYLNDRVTGYPVPSALLTLRSEHNEDRRQAARDDRRRPTRRKGRAARK